MKLFVVTLFVGLATAAQLQNNYLPPNSAGSAGGHGGFLQGPNQAGPSANYLPPKTSFNNAGQPNAFSHGSQGGFGAQGNGGFGAGGAHSQQSGFARQQQTGSFSGSTGFGGSSSSSYASSGQQIPILKYDNINNGDGTYHFDFAAGNGIQQNEDGRVNNPGGDLSEQVVQGSYSYTGDDGQTYTVHYKADGNGFQATGDHLPTPPPIPEAIQRSLEYNAAHPEENSAGAYNGASQGGSSFGRAQGGSYAGGQGSYSAGGNAVGHSGSFGGGAAQRGGSFGGATGHGGSLGGATGHEASFGGASSSHGSSFGGAQQGNSFGGRSQQQYNAQQHQSGGAGGAAGYHY